MIRSGWSNFFDTAGHFSNKHTVYIIIKGLYIYTELVLSRPVTLDWAWSLNANRSRPNSVAYITEMCHSNQLVLFQIHNLKIADILFT